MRDVEKAIHTQQIEWEFDVNKTLAYSMDGYDRAGYLSCVVKLADEQADAIGRVLKRNDSIIRWLVVPL